MILKDVLFNEETVSLLASQIKTAFNDFNESDFIKKSLISFPPLELKERMSSVRVYLEEYLPNDYKEAINILSEAMKTSTESHFVYGAVLEFVEKNGCNDEYVELSLDKLGEFTSYFSAEFAIRPFLSMYEDISLKKVLKWSKSDNLHERRLASEGTRPSLPWAPNIRVNYMDASVALDNLYYDQERYVTRSVANHLNDISKINPIFVLDKLKSWEKSQKQKREEMKYIINHSLRTLIKKGHPETLDLLGFKLHPNVVVENFKLTNEEINIGDSLEFSFIINTFEDCNLLIDYIVYYPTNTKRRNQKIYKLRTIKAQKNNMYPVKGKRSFKLISTRKMKAGIHEINIQINGEIYYKKTFNVL